MPRHRQEGFFDVVFDILLKVPIWVGPLLAGGVYVLLRFVWPALFSSEDITQSVLRGIGPAIALWAALAFLIVWVVAEARKWSRRRLLDTQTGLDSIRTLSWREFEHLVGEAYRRRGYLVEETGTGSGDGGIDLILNGHGEMVLVQCKQWQSHRVGVKPVRELYGVLVSEKADRAVLVTCGAFTADAREFARGKPIELVAADELVALVCGVQLAASPSIQPAAEVPVPARSGGAAAGAPRSASTKTCPECGSAMTLRTAKRGSNAGSRFWGCTSYPSCRATAPYEVA